jgi:hypothetical protein
MATKTLTPTETGVQPMVRAAMAAAPLLLVAAEAISPIDTGAASPEERIAGIFEHTGRYSAALLCLIAGLLLLVPAAQGLRQLVADGAQRLAAIGAGIAGAGFMLFSIASGALGFGPTAWASLGDGERAAAVRFLEATDDGKGVMPVPISGVMLPILGLALVAVALRRGDRGYPRWSAAALPVGWLLFLVAPGHVGRAIGALVLLGGFVPAITRSTSRRLA